MKILELDFALQNLENNSSPGLYRATLVRPDTVGHLVRLDRPAAVGLDVVVPVLLLPAVLMTGVDMNCIVLYCIVLHYIVLYCIALYCIALYCIFNYLVTWLLPRPSPQGPTSLTGL